MRRTRTYAAVTKGEGNAADKRFSLASRRRCGHDPCFYELASEIGLFKTPRIPEDNESQSLRTRFSPHLLYLLLSGGGRVFTRLPPLSRITALDGDFLRL